MKASELRIGNLLHRPDLGNAELRTETVISIGEKVMMSGPIKVLCPYEDLTGIPLTEEWLLKFGFSSKYKYNKEQGYYLKIEHNRNEMRFTYVPSIGFFVTFDSPSPEWDFNIEYVHQLQNLYSALTGEELTINFNK